MCMCLLWGFHETNSQLHMQKQRFIYEILLMQCCKVLSTGRYIAKFPNRNARDYLLIEVQAGEIPITIVFKVCHYFRKKKINK